MKVLVPFLEKRKLFIIKLLLVFALTAIILSFFFSPTPPQYFGGKYNMDFVYALIAYKIIELFVVYYILMHRHILFLRKYPTTLEFIEKLKKHTKLLLFLVIQGNTVFGIIAFKFSGSVLYFLLFSCIALVTLLLLDPKKLLITAEN